uniref:Uncharacterized protein n=1 Tax=Chelonoidis abingdonii TaxID=106734 RepID=A0A8C0GKX4_CHEAB
MLDDNYLSHPSVFVSLANLRSLKQLNLDKNGIAEVPYLHQMENSQFSLHPQLLVTEKEQLEYLILQNNQDPDRTDTCCPHSDSTPGLLAGSRSEAAEGTGRQR